MFIEEYLEYEMIKIFAKNILQEKQVTRLFLTHLCI